MKVLITGASGLLGRRLFEIISKTEETVGVHIGERVENMHFLDISDKNSVESFFQEIKPDVIIHAAALVDVDYCEDHKEETRKVNVEGTKNIVDICKKYRCKMVYLSSDFVFDGETGPYNENSETKPVNYYGETKLEGERIVKENLENYIIIRPAVLYGEDEGCKDSFISKVLRKLINNEKVFADNRIIKYPTLTDDVGRAIKKLIEIDVRGIYNVAGEEAITKYAWAVKIAKAYGFPVENVIPDSPLYKAKRPSNVKLENSKTKRLLSDFSMAKVDEGIAIVKNQKGCLFKMIYSARPDMLVLNQSASDFRIKVGKALAREHPADVDIIIPIPESGIYGASGYAEESKIPFYFGLIRDYFTNKTLFEPTLRMRNAALDKKLIVVPGVVKDKKIVLVDEAILAGTTLAVAVDKLKKAGAREIHVRIPSPPMLYSCKNKILEEDADLIARKFGSKKEEIEKGLKEHFEVDSLCFLSLDGFLSCLSENQVCYECFKKKTDVKIIRLNEVPDEIRGGGSYSIKRLLTEPLKKNPDNAGFYQTTIPPRSAVKNHYHKDLDEFLYFITKGKVRVDTETYEFDPGDIFVLPPGSPHEIFAEDSEVRLIAVKLPNIVDDKVEC